MVVGFEVYICEKLVLFWDQGCIKTTKTKSTYTHTKTFHNESGGLCCLAHESYRSCSLFISFLAFSVPSLAAQVVSRESA